MAEEVASCRAVLEIEVDSADHILAAVDPDNLTAPSHVKVSCVIAAPKKLRCTVTVQGCSEAPERVLTLRNTLDDLLMHLGVAAKTLGSIRE
ncbi:MAG: hypothetical protein F7C07_02855 [Desulfurococcales archaeon]|nr:hypothetical protein [Desulfurococcales archaeon]